MKKGQTSVTDGIQNFLCPFKKINITQVENVGSHLGTKAIDVASDKVGEKAAYYAPADIVCVNVIPSYGESRWQTVNKVRCPNGYVGIVTFEIAHDDSFNAYVGMKLKQGEKLGNMGTKSGATSAANKPTGVHCHIQFSQSKTNTFAANKYGVYGFPTESYCDDTMYIDGTTIVNTGQAKWKNAPKESASTSASKCPFKSSGTVKALYDKIRVRTSPSTSKGDTGSYYNTGMTLNYQSVVTGDGWYWAKYKSYDGDTHYCALCKTDGSSKYWKQK